MPFSWPVGPNSPGDLRLTWTSKNVRTSQEFQQLVYCAIICYTAIYAPTPRKMSVKVSMTQCLSFNRCVSFTVCFPQRKIERRAPPAKRSVPTVTKNGPTPEPVDEPCPVYEVIPEPEQEVYLTLADFQAPGTGDGLSFSAGCSVTVVTKNASGWWYVEMGDKEGWVPSSYLERAAKNETLQTPPPKLPAKRSPVKRRELPQSGNKAALRRSTSEETLKRSQLKPSPSHKGHVNSPPGKSTSSSLLTASTPHLSSPQQRKPTISVPSHTNKKTLTTGGNTHTPIGRSSSSGDQATRPKPHLAPRAQQSATSLSVPKPHTKSRSADGSTNSRERTLSSRTDHNRPVSELAQLLQKKQATLSANSSAKPSSPRATPKTATPKTATQKTASPSTKRLDLSVKQPPQRPKPYNTTATTKRAPPKRPEPPKSNTISHTKKTPPPRPSTSPSQTRKTSVGYTAVCEYTGGDGQMSLRAGQIVEVLEKCSDGWWYVKAGSEEGWAPSSFLEEGKSKPGRPANGPSHPKTEHPIAGSSKPTPAARPIPKPRRSPQTPHASNSMYRAAVSYQVPVYEDSGITLVAGQLYEVLEKKEGWWFVKDTQGEGWAPASYLDPA